MRILLLGTAAVALSGCSWLGLGGGHHGHHDYNSDTGYYGHTAKKTKKACGDDQCLARWNIEAAAGPDFVVGGKALTGDRLHPNDGTLRIDNVKMKDAYHMGYRAELGGSYALTPNRKVTANGFYNRADGEDNVVIGEQNNTPVRANFSDYKSYGAEIGMRQYMAPRKGLLLNSVRPYVEGKLGAAYVDDISMTDITDTVVVPLYDSGWVPTAAGMVGVETPLFNQMTVGLESGIRYTGKPESDNSVLSAGNPAAGINNGGDRWTVPVMLRGRYRF